MSICVDPCDIENDLECSVCAVVADAERVVPKHWFYDLMWKHGLRWLGDTQPMLSYSRHNRTTYYDEHVVGMYHAENEAWSKVGRHPTAPVVKMLAVYRDIDYTGVLYWRTVYSTGYTRNFYMVWTANLLNQYEMLG